MAHMAHMAHLTGSAHGALATAARAGHGIGRATVVAAAIGDAGVRMSPFGHASAVQETVVLVAAHGVDQTFICLVHLLIIACVSEKKSISSAGKARWLYTRWVGPTYT